MKDPSYIVEPGGGNRCHKNRHKNVNHRGKCHRGTQSGKRENMTGLKRTVRAKRISTNLLIRKKRRVKKRIIVVFTSWL